MANFAPPHSIQAVGITAALFMSGIYFGTSAIAIRPLLALPTHEVTRIFADLYYTGARFVVPLALASAAITGTSAYLIPEARTEYSISTASTLGTLIFTGVFMLSGINRLLTLGKMGKGEAVSREEVLALMREWQMRNFVRAGLAFAGGVFGILGVAKTVS